MTPEEAFASSVCRLEAKTIDQAGPLGIAVSGGGDSLALLHVASAWARAQGRAILAVTVDHGLRQDAATEAAFVAQACADLGVSHNTLSWRERDWRGNLQDQARQARQRLISEWAAVNRIGAVGLGHTADDQAETVLLRLSRGSGVDGLSGMREAVQAGHGWWLRPFLDVPRGTLRDWLSARDIAWVEDPSNEDRRFDRTKARAMAEQLGSLGLSRDRLVRTAEHMHRAQASLRLHAEAVAAREAREEGADLCLSVALLRRVVSEDTPGRLLAAALGWVGNRPYRPRHEALMRLAHELLQGRPATLSGCRVRPEGDLVRISRETRAYAPAVAVELAGTMLRARWDGRWSLHRGATSDDLEGSSRVAHLRIAALGEAGLEHCPDWPRQGLPCGALLATPAVWDGDRLIAAPLAGRSEGWTATLHPHFPCFVRDR